MLTLWVVVRGGWRIYFFGFILCRVRRLYGVYLFFLWARRCGLGRIFGLRGERVFGGVVVVVVVG